MSHARRRIFLWIAIFGWLLAIGIGWGVARWTDGSVPMAIFPLAWLACMGLSVAWLRSTSSTAN